MPTHYKAHTFKESDTWETVDTYWSSPLSYWAMKSMRVEPPVPLRVMVLRREVSASDEGWINYGGISAVLVQSVQARGRAGEKIRAVINDGTIDEDGEIRD
ncbi:MAG: hypothetical protein KUG77_26800 [Nannocystaceae bacterium]|nr:hypothetical protein [Nannocystaceae bacterium]